MITNFSLGYSGRLGNQMYQFGILYILSKINGFDIKIPIENVLNFDNNLSKVDLFSVFDLDRSILCPFENLKHCKTSDYWNLDYNELILKIADNTSLQGHFQSYKYYHDYRQDIKLLYKFIDPIEKVSCDIIEFFTEKYKHDIVGIHVRRGDYIKLQNFVGLGYYLQSIKLQFNDKPYTFLVCSDDVPWCKSNLENVHTIDEFEFRHDYHINSSGCRSVIEMSVLSKCNHIISSNSTFGWWSCFLNKPDGKIIMPKKWFSDYYRFEYAKIPGMPSDGDELFCWPGVIVI